MAGVLARRFDFFRVCFPGCPGGCRPGAVSGAGHVICGLADGYRLVAAGGVGGGMVAGTAAAAAGGDAICVGERTGADVVRRIAAEHLRV